MTKISAKPCYIKWMMRLKTSTQNSANNWPIRMKKSRSVSRFWPSFNHFYLIGDNIFDPVLCLVTAQNADLMEAINDLETSIEQMQKSIGNEINSCKSI